MLRLLFPTLRRIQIRAAGLHHVLSLFCQPFPSAASGSFSGFSVSPLPLWYFSHSYAQMQLANPFASGACLHDTRQQSHTPCLP